MLKSFFYLYLLNTLHFKTMMTVVQEKDTKQVLYNLGFHRERPVTFLQFEYDQKKDRTVPLSQGILELLRKYYLAYRPQSCLFEGQYTDSPYSTRSLQQIFRRAKTKACISQDVSFHSLRHSYATHLHEAGTDIHLIQELLVHKDLNTTLRYTHVSKRTLENVKSPFDNLHLSPS